MARTQKSREGKSTRSKETKDGKSAAGKESTDALSEAAPPSEEAEADLGGEEDEGGVTRIGAGRNEKYEAVKRGEIHLTALQRMTMSELIQTAKREYIEDYSGLKKQELIFNDARGTQARA